MISAVFILAGCAGERVSQGQRMQELAEERAALIPAGWKDSEEVKLSLDDAVALAFRSNLDLRVSALEVLSRQNNVSLEKLSAMPEFKIVAGYQGRSNPGASSSRSLLTGRQSLEPSISSDQYRTTTDLDMRWNVLDVAMAVSRSRSADNAAKAAAERHRAMQAKVVQDVVAAYGRAYSVQEVRPALERLLAEA
ncbi:MAG: TolC family protein, partial [Alphaproteobacteria bacterium]|nr:TolC family protein [Alphaproteobacteria bacterium]